MVELCRQMGGERGIIQRVVEFDPKPISMGLGISTLVGGLIMREDMLASVGMAVFIGTCMGESWENSVENKSGRDEIDRK